MISFSKKLKELRKEKGITQTELAKQLNVTAGTIGMYESDRATPSVEMLVAIVKFFNITYDELFEYVE